MEKPLVSIILTIYNIEHYLPKCMDSLFRQTYENLEFIMVDDGSKEECAKLVDEYQAKDARVVVYHKKNGGLSDARNYGIKHARGKYITCVDPDDYVDDDYVEYLYTILMKFNAKMSIAQHRVRYDNGSVKENGTKGNERISTERCLERMLYHDVIDTSACSKLYHYSLFETVQYPDGRLFEDIATTYKLMMQCEYIAVGYESKYNYVFHDKSIVNSDFRPAKFDLLEMTDRMASDVVKRFPKLEDAVLRRQVYARFSTLNQMLNTTEYRAEKKEIIKFIKNSKWKILRNPNAPKRDKIAILLLSISAATYKYIWLSYRNSIMGGQFK